MKTRAGWKDDKRVDRGKKARKRQKQKEKIDAEAKVICRSNLRG